MDSLEHIGFRRHFGYGLVVCAPLRFGLSREDRYSEDSISVRYSLPGDRNMVPHNLISIMQAYKLLIRKNTGYLAYVVDTRAEEKGID